MDTGSPATRYNPNVIPARPCGTGIHVAGTNGDVECSVGLFGLGQRIDYRPVLNGFPPSQE